jgi:hypothetical protein
MVEEVPVPGPDRLPFLLPDQEGRRDRHQLPEEEDRDPVPGKDKASEAPAYRRAKRWSRGAATAAAYRMARKVMIAKMRPVRYERLSTRGALRCIP